MYDVLVQIKGSIGGGVVDVGRKNNCRYCGATDRRLFRKDAHTFPEALGNKWVFSRDECDDCNFKFSKYEDALAKAIGAILTIGGVKGKGNHTRQTGRTGGDSAIRHLRDEQGRRRLSTFLNNLGPGAVIVGTHGDTMTFRIPISPERFVPRYAYKALTKMAFALLPDDERANYRETQAWLLDVNDAVDFPVLEVALSYTLLGNAPPLVCGTLLRRTEADAPIPHILFVLAIGSLCFQIDLRSDHLEEHVPPLLVGTSIRDWRIGLANPNGPGPDPFILTYTDPVVLNWSSRTPRLQVLTDLLFHFNTSTTEAEFQPVLRDDPWSEELSSDGLSVDA